MTGVLAVNNDFPVRTESAVHSGKVRSVYWLTAADSARLIAQRGYPVPPDTALAAMVVSDRISAFDCIWRDASGRNGVAGKGAALNAISQYWFDQFAQAGLAGTHILEAPHPLVWIVRRAQPVRIEAIARRHITGSMWRAYEKGTRRFCGIELPDGLQQHQRLPELLITPSTKGILSGLEGIPAEDDTAIGRGDIDRHWQALGFARPDDVDHYEMLLGAGFALIEQRLAGIGQIFVDTKFEFGYVTESDGSQSLIYMDEVGTPDSSRLWDARAFEDGSVIENSKEQFRKALLQQVADPDVLTNSARMPERKRLAADMPLPDALFDAVSATYVAMAEAITGTALSLPDAPRDEILQLFGDELGLID